MKKRKEKFIRQGIITPIIISIIVSALFFAVYSILVENAFFEERYFAFADYTQSDIKEAERIESESSFVRVGELGSIEDNTVIGSAYIDGHDMPIIFNANELNRVDRLNLDRDSVFIGETGCAYLHCEKKNASTIRMLSKDDVITIDTCYGSYEYIIVDIKTAKTGADLKSAADEFGRAIAVYTDESVGIGTSDVYYVVIGEMVNGKKVVQ